MKQEIVVEHNLQNTYLPFTSYQAIYQPHTPLVTWKMHPAVENTKNLSFP